MGFFLPRDFQISNGAFQNILGNKGEYAANFDNEV